MPKDVEYYISKGLDQKMAEYFASGRKHIIAVAPNRDFTLTISFDNGEQRILDMIPVLKPGTVFEPFIKWDTSAIVLTVSAGIIMVIILLLSKRAVRPMAESYEKQKQFITDANHELKTPLTLILTNLDIVESELGHSEWIDDIRSEGKRMNGLVEQLTALSRLDEDKSEMSCSDFSISEVCNDTVSEFSQLVESKGLSMSCDIEADVNCCGDEAAIRRLIAILLDNAVKYCSANGNISLSLEQKKHTVITVENSCATVDSMELDRLFDRFYRADKARTAGNSFGIGLSLAKSITEKHHGSIKAYKAGPERIGFRATIK